MSFKKVLLIGWDGADWKIIHPLLDSGMMPNLSKMIKEGIMGNLSTLYPSFSPMLWTSIITGKRPYKHGILGFIEPEPSGCGIRPITNISRKTRALWNIMTLNGLKSAVVGWWPSHPAEPINGVMVSNHFQKAVAPHGKPWPLMTGAIHPERLIRNLSSLRVHPQELDVNLILNFIPRLSEIDQGKDHRVEAIAKIISECTTVNRVVTAIMHHETWDFTAVYYDGIDHFCHGFINYYPPKLSWVNGKDFDLYKNVVESGYIYHDILLGTLLKEAGEDTVVILVSDHGFHSDNLRPRGIPMEIAGAAVQHRHYGIFIAKGPGIKSDELVYGASLLDITPTILTIMGMPVGEDMDGKPLLNIFEDKPIIKTIPGWDDVKGYDGCHPPDIKMDPIEAKEILEQLAALGYIEEPDNDEKKAVEDCVRELQFNLAKSYMDAGLYIKSIPILEELYKLNPDEYRIGIQLVINYQNIKDFKKARTLLEEILERKKKNAKRAQKELKEFRKNLKDRPYEEWSKEEQNQFKRLRKEAGINIASAEFLLGNLLGEEEKYEEALEHLEKAREKDKMRPDVYCRSADIYMKIGSLSEAEENFRKALEIDPENSEAHLGLCRVFLKQKKYMEAIEEGLVSVGLIFHNPKAHYYLGVTFHRMGKLIEAIQALKISISQNPNFAPAHKRLAHIYRNRLKDNLLAERHEKSAQESEKLMKNINKIMDNTLVTNKIEYAGSSLTSDLTTLIEMQKKLIDKPFDIKNTIIIVTGLPRSGTSMMMQILEKGGLQIFTDEVRKADENNPKGYFEYEGVKSLKRASSWLKDVRGKAIKIVVPVIQYLPSLEHIDYRVIFVERKIDEIMASQKSMLKSIGKTNKLCDSSLRKILSQQVHLTKIILALKEIPTFYVDYNETLIKPEEISNKINKFLGSSLNVSSMIEAIIPALKRH